MTFAELLLFVVGVVALVRLLRPLQRRLETYFRRAFRSTRPRAPYPIIDITEYDKKDHEK